MKDTLSSHFHHLALNFCYYKETDSIITRSKSKKRLTTKKIKTDTIQTEKDIRHIIDLKNLEEENIRIHFSNQSFSWQIQLPNGEIYEGCHHLTEKINIRKCNNPFEFKKFAKNMSFYVLFFKGL